MDENKANTNGDAEEKDDKEKSKKSEWKQKSFGEKLAFIQGYVTVEPVLVCYLLPSILGGLAVQHLFLEKACRVNKNYGDEKCTKFMEGRYSNKTDEEAEVQALVTYMTAWTSPMVTTLTAITILFVGAWSDKSGRRKPYMLVPLFGEFISFLGLVLCTIYYLEWPLEVAGIMASLPTALTGGWAMMFMAVFSHIADNTSIENRTFKIGVVNLVTKVTNPIGASLSGILFEKLHFQGVFWICAAIYAFSICYVYFGVKDKNIEKDAARQPAKDNCCGEYLNWRYIYDTFMIIFKPRKYNKHTIIILVILCYIIIAGPILGSGPLTYLYLMRSFQFSPTGYSIFSTYSIIVNLLGTLIGISVLSKYLQMDDSLIAILACMGKVIAFLIFAFAPNTIVLYFGPIAELIGAMAMIGLRSIATKIVEPDEVGKIIALFGVCDAVVNIIYAPLFSAIYNNMFLGAHNMFAALFTAPAIIIFTCMFVLQKRDENSERKEKTSLKGEENVACDIDMTQL